jgi:hypothetical protein
MPIPRFTSPRTLLLADIRAIFAMAEVDKIASGDLVDKLVEIETSPWGEWRQGKPMTVRALARELRYFEIAPRTIRFDDGSVKKGYLQESFVDAWERYVPDCNCNSSKNEVSTSVDAGCNGVTDKRGGTEASGIPDKPNGRGSGSWRCPECHAAFDTAPTLDWHKPGCPKNPYAG